MIISKVIDFRSFSKNLLKIQKFDRGACLGIVYESILRFEQFLIDIKFRRDLEIFSSTVGWRGGLGYGAPAPA